MEEFMEGSTQDPKIVAALSLYNINARDDSYSEQRLIEEEEVEIEEEEEEKVDVEDIRSEIIEETDNKESSEDNE